jgi:hypothetical protein
MYFSIPAFISLLIATSIPVFASPLPNAASAETTTALAPVLDIREPNCNAPVGVMASSRCVVQRLSNGVSAATYALSFNDVMQLTNGLWSQIANAPAGQASRAYSQKEDNGQVLAEVTISLRNAATDWPTLGNLIGWGNVFDAVKMATQNAKDAGNWRNYYWIKDLQGQTLAVIVVIVMNAV